MYLNQFFYVCVFRFSRVCTDTATGIHYGIATCEGCKVNRQTDIVTILGLPFFPLSDDGNKQLLSRFSLFRTSSFINRKKRYYLGVTVCLFITLMNDLFEADSRCFFPLSPYKIMMTCTRVLVLLRPTFFFLCSF